MINRSAVLHIPVSQYAFALNEHTITIRLRTEKNNIHECSIFWGDRACNSSPVTFTETKMKVCWRDECFDFWEVTLSQIPRRLCYYFKLTTEQEWSYYYADQFSKQVPDVVMDDGFVIEGRSEYYQYPYILQSEILNVPEWFRNAIVYNIFPDSFASQKQAVSKQGFEIIDEDGNRHISRLGGTIRGIVENLEYIKDLGFNCIYLNPIFSAGEYHKYDIIDYYHVDRTLGTDEDFMELTRKVHEMGMHIIIDGVFNHCGWKNPFFQDVVKKGKDSAFWNWFYELSTPMEVPKDGEEPSYACFAYEKKMPKLNTSHPEVQAYFAQVGKHWIEKFHVDGWRLDVANEIDKNFWRMFKKAVREANTEAVLIGEVWENSKDWLGCDMMDSTMNYDFRKHCREFLAKNHYSPENFRNAMTDMLLRYPKQLMEAQLNLLDSHDVPRFLSLCEGDINKWKLAFLCLAFFPGVPSMFYGDEREITGLREEEYRSPMAWERETNGTQKFIREVLTIRKDWVPPEALWVPVETTPEEKVFVFELKKEHTIRIILSVSRDYVDIERYTVGGYPLMENGIQGKYLSGYGYQVLKMA